MRKLKIQEDFKNEMKIRSNLKNSNSHPETFLGQSMFCVREVMISIRSQPARGSVSPFSTSI